MNQVPWRRILERAEGEPPSEGGAAIINLHDHAPGRLRSRRNERHADVPGDLEAELKQALNRHERDKHGRGRGMPAAPPARWDPADDERAGRMRVPPQRSVARTQKPARSDSGRRNLLALTLSVAVIALAIHQISGQWSAAQHGGADADNATHAGAADRTDRLAPDANAAGQRLQFAGNRIDLRPSLADDGASAETPATVEARQAALERDIRDAARLLISGADGNRAGAAGGDSSSAEQAMLRRGHQMIDQGHIAGARLVFEHLAEQNSALGAFALAQTYDPSFLASRRIEGAQPDETLAAKWYQRAAQLTDANAPR